jgi:xanthine dehydrogenase/oxidase
LSEEAHAKIVSVDTSKALTHEGVVAYFSAKDFPGVNDCGPVFHDEELFASETVICVGYPIGIVVAKTQRLAQQGAKLIQVKYEKLPSVLTIEEAISSNSFYPIRHEISLGSLDSETWALCDHVEAGSFTMGGQEHFYLECQTTLAIPGEDDEMTIWSSTQNPSKTQSMVAKSLNIPSHKVVSKLKRLGGGFGGKETRSVFVSCAAALAAHKLRMPVRISLDRDEDMAITGARHPYYSTYKVGFSKEGKLLALDVDMYSNAGCTHDLSIAVGERSLFSLMSAYQCPNIHARMTACKTNLPSNTAFRGFGAPQSMMVMEVVMDRIVSTVKRSPNDVREMNFSKDGDSTYYGQALPVCNAGRVWEHLMARVNYEQRLKAVEAFNASNRYVKRGIVCMPTQFGLSFTLKLMNQAGALVHLYPDGTVLVSTGGVEMGQGLNTKLIQIAAQELGVTIDKVHIAETATDKVPNTMPSAASVSTDLNGMAVVDACKVLNERLAPFRSKSPSATFADIVTAAHLKRVSLSATGFYATPNVHGFDWKTGRGSPFAYFTWGAACSEVEIDCLTGGHTVIRSDLVMDVGQSINPSIDIGQVEGAFAQGYGLTVLEEIVFDDRFTRTPGKVFTRGPSTYKIPAFKDIPLQLNVHLMPGSQNPNTVHSSKGVGEPPLHLGCSVFFAIKQAIAAARANYDLHGDFDLESPATCERIRMGCQDKFTSIIQNSKIAIANGK